MKARKLNLEDAEHEVAILNVALRLYDPNESPDEVAARIDDHAERARKIYEMSLAGKTRDEIGQELGITYQTAATDIKFWIQKTVMPLAEDVKKQQLDRLEMLWRAAYDKSVRGDVPAMNTAIKILERQAKLLGLDINKIQFENTGTDPREIELIELINEAKVKMKAEEDRLRQGTLPPS